MSSCSYAHFDHVIGKNIYEWNSASEGGFGSNTGEKEYMLPTERNVGIREGTKTLLQAIRTVKNVSVFDESLVSSIQPPLLLPLRGEEKMMSAFHTKRISASDKIFFVKLGLLKPLDPMIS